MNIRQLQIQNENIQDRLLLRIATPANEEMRVHITRRFLRELWPHLVTMLEGHLASRPSLSTDPANTAASETASFSEPYQATQPTLPLGASPILASEANLVAAGPGLAQLTLREGRERSVALTLNGDLMRAFCSMLRAGADKARWDLELPWEAPSSSPQPLIVQDAPKLLH